jgi:hypothetical protein
MPSKPATLTPTPTGQRRATPHRRCLVALLGAVIATAVLGGCASSRQERYLRPKAVLVGDLDFSDVAVQVDQGQNRDLAWEMGELATLRTRRNARFAGEPPLPASLRVVQRTYLNHLDSLALRTSIHGALSIKDTAGEPLLMSSYYTLGTKTILSAKVQRKVVGKLLKQALRRQRSDYHRWCRHNRKLARQEKAALRKQAKAAAALAPPPLPVEDADG